MSSRFDQSISFSKLLQEFQHLADTYGISEQTASQVCLIWISFLLKELRFCIQWPTKEQVATNLPHCFKHSPKTISVNSPIVHFFEQKLNLPSSQEATWSCYKHHDLVKAVVSTTLSGTTISFISKLWPGNVSDRQLVKNWFSQPKIQPRDHMIADCGFVLRDLLALRGANLEFEMLHGS